ncbi:MAG TPA: lamin tail domain-containing protein [Anaerolineales bacterium]|nr:lamin tail domain-containing protein [Anaerolineales bacterium]
MSRNVIFVIAVSLSFLGVAACGTVSTPDGAVTILPKDCRIKVGEQIPLTLNGLVPPNAMITWEASAGSLISAPPALNALFIAPPEPTIVTITVTISSGTPSIEIPITRQCIVTSPENVSLQSLPSTGSDGEPSAPLVQVTPAQGMQSTVIISEVMANPCGPLEVRKWNEYVELYNYGTQPVDVGGWWLADTGESGAGSPDQLVSWSQRNPNELLGSNLVLNSTIIPARGYALILSPIYAQGAFPYTMPYRFPANTTILTVASSRSLGDDYFNIIGDGPGLDVLVLYKGGTSVIQEVLSTYGTPKVDQYVTNIRDDNRDNLPFDLHECSSAERILPAGADTFDNWREIPNGSPGEAPY